MSRAFRAIVAALLLAPGFVRAETRSPGAIRFRTEAGYDASLYYLIDNMAGGSFRASPYYWSFWKKTYGFADGDQALLDRCAAIRGKFESRNKEPDAWPRMFLDGKSLDEVWPKLAQKLSKQDVVALKTVYRRFGGIYRPYWDKHSAYLDRSAADFESAGMSREVPAFLARVSDYFELPNDFKRDDLLVFVWHPGLKISANLMHGRRVGSVMFVEIPEGLGYEDQIDVAVHEFIHDLFAAVPPGIHASFDEDLIKGDRRSGLFFIQGMNEGLATALGQGVFMAARFPKRFKPDGEWYATGVDDFAKAIYPEVRTALESGATLRSTADRLAAAIKPVAERAKLPAFFKSHVLLMEKVTDPLIDPLFFALDIASVNEYAPNESARQREDARKKLDEDPSRPVVAMVLPASLRAPLTDLLDGVLDEKALGKIRRLAAHRAVAVTGSAPSGRLCLLLIGTPEQIEDGLRTVKNFDYPSAPAAFDLSDGRPLAL